VKGADDGTISFFDRQQGKNRSQRRVDMYDVVPTVAQAVNVAAGTNGPETGEASGR
jgi:hypothetical protein